MIAVLVQVRGLLLTHQQVLPLLLTLGAYAAGVAMQRTGRRHSLLNPTLLAISMVVATLLLLRIDYRAYFAGAQPVHVLLGPAVVALAVPLYRHLDLIRERAVLLLAALAVGSLSAIASSVAIGWWLGASRPDLLSLAPKSATTAVSMAISAQIGGLPAVTAVLTILAGISGAVLASPVLNALRIRDPAARGFGMGLASHGIATARAFQDSETAGTFAGLAMGLNAIATAALAPLVVRFLIH
jgi:predicted murein hydrolase (TIGR00659 family)